jgi:glutamate N-acetyltransferase/amino-acid N-acetyltransferase
VRAACVDFNRRLTPAEGIRGLVVNSGNANACTGKQGEQDNERLAALLAEAGGFPAGHALTLSTGIIGEHLPMDKLSAGVPAAVAAAGTDSAAFEAAARGMITTDKTLKVATTTATLAGGNIQLAGAAKGAGMIGPKMATMLSVVLTDAKLSAVTAQKLLTGAVERSFNRISVEGHMSTNDAAILLASGHGPALTGEADTAAFAAGLDKVCLELARQIPADGEGATHLIEVVVTGAANDDEADRVARTIASSNLVKTAVAGADPNWGRIVSAAGYSGAAFDPTAVQLTVNGFTVYESGTPAPFDAAAVSQHMRDNFDTRLHITLGPGPGEAVHYCSDLTAEYVRINADYHT